MKRILTLLFCFVIIFTISPAFAAEASEAIHIYVSPIGSDNASGEKDAPFKTIEAAQKKVRKMAENMRRFFVQ